MKTLHTPPEIKKATGATLPLLPGLRDSLHLKALTDVFLSAKRGKFSKLHIIVVMALLLAIPAAVLILSNGLNKASDNLQQARRISMFMDPSTPTTVAEQLSEMLINNNSVSTASLIALQSDSQNDLVPVMLEVTPSPGIGTVLVIELADQLRALAGVEFVELNIERLGQTELTHNQLTRYAQAFNAAALIIAGLLMLAISYRDVRESKNNIRLMKQLGGTLTDIRRPFLYRGPALGALAAALGIFGATAIIWTTTKLFDMSPYTALMPLKPTFIQLLMFFAVVMLAGFTANLRFFSTKFTFYNQ